jgi:hypothetical protein
MVKQLSGWLSGLLRLLPYCERYCNRVKKPSHRHSHDYRI